VLYKLIGKKDLAAQLIFNWYAICCRNNYLC